MPSEGDNMKLYINERTYRPERNPREFIRELRLDLSKVASIDTQSCTYDDILSLDVSRGARDIIKNCVDKAQKKGWTPEDCVDDILVEIQGWMDWFKQELKDRQEQDIKADEIYRILDNFLNNNYEVIEQKFENGYFEFVIEPSELSDHSDCINFADDIVAAVKGRYYGTGRGGSWSMWNILAYNGLELKAGWKDHSDNFIVKAI